MSFTDPFRKYAPSTIILPAELVKTLDWLDAFSNIHTFENGAQFAPLYTASEMKGVNDVSCVGFQIFDDFYYDFDALPRKDVKERLFLCVQTGGDGSHAGIWIDEAGVQKFVHIGSGSGSIWGGVITESAVDFLRFLAIGYLEPAFIECHDKTVEAAWFEYNGYELDDKAELIEEGDYHPTVPPFAFQKFLEETFDTHIPERASEIIQHPAPTYDDPKDDPFAHWLISISG